MPSGSTSPPGSDPTLTLPPSEQVAADGTIAVSGASYADSFAANNPGSLYLSISDNSGLLYGYDPTSGSSPVTGSGTDAIVFQGSYADVEAIINSLTYAATSAGGSDDIHYDVWNQAGVQTTGDVPVSIGSGSTVSSGGGAAPSPGNGSAPPPGGHPSLNEPASETITAGASQPVSGSYTDSFAAGNPGELYLSITDSSGTLSATDAGTAVAGSGTSSIALNAGYAEVNAILQSLTYTAGAGAGSDSIHFDVWNQQGVETTDSVPVTIAGSSAPSSSETWTGAVSSDWNTAGNWSGGAVPNSGATIVIPAGTANDATLSDATLTGDTITLQGGANDAAAVVAFNNVVLDSTLRTQGSGMLQLGGTLTVGSQGTLAGSGLLTVAGTAETIVNNGLIQGVTGGALDVYNNATAVAATATLINNGILATDGGNLNFIAKGSPLGGLPDWTLINAGSIAIAGGGLDVDGTIGGGTIAFGGSGSLSLEQGMALTNGAIVTGFGQGEQIDPANGAAGKGGQLSFANGTLDVTVGGTLVQAIPMQGSLGLGNFEIETVANPGNGSEIAYAAGGQPSGFANPDVVAPGSASVAQGGTLALNDVSIENLGTSGSLTITAGSGTLYMNGASGSGTSQLSLGPTPNSQLNADLASLTYVPTAGASSDTVSVTAAPAAAPVDTTRWIPISITSGSSGPTLHEPVSETVAPGASVAVNGSYADSFASGNPGELFLGISDGTGTLSATNAAGQAVAGSGSNSIGVQADYVDVNAILASLHYTAGTNAGSDTINFQVWNQAGVETTGATAVTVDPPSNDSNQASAMTLADFATPGTTPVVSTSNGSSAGSVPLQDTATQPIGMPLPLGH